MDKKTVCIIIGVVVAVLLILQLSKKRESYSNLSDLDNVGTFTNPPPYEFVQASGSLVGQLEPRADEYFANIVAPSSGCGANSAGASEPKPAATALQRLTNLQGSDLMPRVNSKAVSPFNLDVSDPATYSFAISMPRVQIKSRTQDYSSASMIRGDIPITYYADIPMVGRSQYTSADNLNMSGLFTPYFKAKYNKLSGAGYRNTGLMVANQEVLMS
jgi:hypothetical protein